MAVQSPTGEVEALEQARSRLEAALATDENWRALRQPLAQDGEVDAARRARNTRLEMALADNELYQAWKHLNDAIAVLRAKRPALAAVTNATVGAGTARQEAAASVSEVVAEAMRVISPSLMRRLEKLEREQAARPPEPQKPVEEPVGGEARGRGPAKMPVAPISPPPRPEATEATVTFVVRESGAPPLPQAKATTESADEAVPELFEALLAPEGEREPPDQPTGEDDGGPGQGGEEAEVTILSSEGVRLRQEAEQRAGIVRRFRKALTGE